MTEKVPVHDCNQTDTNIELKLSRKVSSTSSNGEALHHEHGANLARRRARHDRLRMRLLQRHGSGADGSKDFGKLLASGVSLGNGGVDSDGQSDASPRFNKKRACSGCKS